MDRPGRASAKSKAATASSTRPACIPARTPPGRPGRCSSASAAWPANTWGGAPVHPASERTGGYGIDGDDDGIATSTTPATPSPPPPAFLQAHGAPGDIQAALFAYNHSGAYVTDVLGWAARYAAGGAQAISAAGSPLCQQAALGPLPAGTAGKVIAYAEAQLGKPYQ